jgi:hypothetical protein
VQIGKSQSKGLAVGGQSKLRAMPNLMEGSFMRNISSDRSKAFGGAVTAVAMMVAGIAAAPAVHAKPKPKMMTSSDGSKIILAGPASLPELARQNGEAMLLRETGDGRMFLYIEQDRGAQLAIFDVSDPSDIKARGAVHLRAAGSFDFVAAAGDHAEAVRFRESQEVAVLDLRQVDAPAIKSQETLKSPVAAGHAAESPDDDQPNAYRAVAVAANLQEPTRAFDIEGVRMQLTNTRTGTTFLMTADGLYAVRRQALEREYAAQQDQLSNP